MATLQPSLPDDTIRRILYVHPRVHIYQIPPLASTQGGHTAAAWTVNPPLFTAALHIIEETISTSTKPTTAPLRPPSKPAPNPPPPEHLTTTLHLLDPTTHALFAAAPYTAPGCVEAARDSARFFAVRVVGDGGRRAVLGLGFEERSDAFDFGVALAECRKVLGFGGPAKNEKERAVQGKGKGKGKGLGAEKARDLSLKEGEMITVDIAGLARRRRENGGLGVDTGAGAGAGAGAAETVPPLLPPPPSAVEVKRLSRELNGRDTVGGQEEFEGKTAEELGFDDGEFGEFQ